MANVRLNTATRTALADAMNTLMNAGAGAATIKFYTATQPAAAADAITSQTLLATLTCTDPAGAAAAAGVLTFSAITQDVSADATGTVTWARIADSNGVTIFDCDVATASATIIIDNASVVTGAPVSMTSFTLTMPAA